jgi:YebC/PmpR family DNA-binding regulatory protein
MSGHSKWSQIKRQKGVNDSRRGQVFTKIGREIAMAARAGGADPDGNFRLRLVIEKAREANMPMENIKRAIERATGGAEGVVYDEVVYEGYGPSGVAFLIETMTDNRNRTVADVRNVLTRGGGNLGETGSVAWNFERKGDIVVDTSTTKTDPDELALEAIDLGAEDVSVDGDEVEIYTDPTELESVREKLAAKKLNIVSSDLRFIPKTTVRLEPAKTQQVMALMEKLEDMDDVQNVASNLDIPDELALQFAS